MTAKKDINPYKPGAGHSPPYFAGRTSEISEFKELLQQDEITKNLIVTGLRGVGKTVLMDEAYKPLAIQAGWVWVGSDFSETAFLTEDNLCLRIITDLSVFSSGLTVSKPSEAFGFGKQEPSHNLGFDFLMTLFSATPGLATDKLKAVLELVWKSAEAKGTRGIIFAYDEAQLVADRKDDDQYPLAVLLESFQSIQRKGAKCMLLLTGLPTLFPRLVESRTYAERMFFIQEVGRLNTDAAREAIVRPLLKHSWQFSDEAVETIIKTADGYPYFIQFICRQAFDYMKADPGAQSIPIDPIVRQLDTSFFAGKWDSLTDRQRELLYCIAKCEHAVEEFTIAEIVDVSKSKKCERVKAFSAGDVSQAIPRLVDRGLIFKNRHGKYSFAVPLFPDFIIRSMERDPMRPVQRSLFERQ